MTEFMLNVRFDKDIDKYELENLKPNEILKKCEYIVSVDMDDCLYIRNGPESPYTSNTGVYISLIIEIKENKGTLVTKKKIKDKIYEEFDRNNIKDIEFVN